MYYYIYNFGFFRIKFGNVGNLMDQNLKPGMVGEILHNNQHIFYLIVKKHVVQMLNKENLQKALIHLFGKMTMSSLTKLALPITGFDHFPVSEAEDLISKTFEGSNIEVFMCSKLSVSYHFF